MRVSWPLVHANLMGLSNDDTCHASARSRPTSAFVAATIAMALLCAPAIFGAEPTPRSPSEASPDLTELSIEKLRTLKVSSAAKKPQKIMETTAAVCVLTARDIQRTGATTLPEVLRTVPGIQVARIDANKWAVTARGFNGLFAAQLLVLIDGRTVYSPLFSGVFWDAQDIPLEDIERIEVVRGPGGAYWGANAVNGVINIVTKDAAQTEGALVSVASGLTEPLVADVRSGTRIGPHTSFRVEGRATSRASREREDGTPASDAWSATRGGFRIDHEPSERDHLTLLGGAYNGNEGVSGLVIPILEAPYARVQDSEGRISGGYALARWSRKRSETDSSTLQVFFDRTIRIDPLYSDRRSTFDLDFQHRMAATRRMDLLWGLGVRTTSDSLTGSEVYTLAPPAQTTTLLNAFAADELTVVPDHVHVTLGAKLEHDPSTGFQLQPSLRGLWLPSQSVGVWAAVSRAVRTPSRGEESATFNARVVPAPDSLPILVQVTGGGLKAANVVAYESGVRFRAREQFSLDVAAHYNNYRNVRTVDAGSLEFVAGPGTPHYVYPFRLTNGETPTTYGVEIDARWTP
jgi:iron complex outermembrane receptor protein